MQKQAEKETTAAAQRDAPSGVAALRVPPWLRYAGYAALGLASTLTIAVGAASYPLSGLKMGCPVYLVHGTGDQLTSTAHSENIYEALGGEKQIWFVEGARHARSIRHARREYS